MLAAATIGCEPEVEEPSFTEAELYESMGRIDQVCGQARAVSTTEAPLVYEEIRKATTDAEHPDLVLKLYRIYTGRSPRWRASSPEQINCWDVTRIVLAEKLGRMGHPEAPVVLTDLMFDRSVELTPTGEQTLSQAITAFGEPCLVHLQTVPATHPQRERADRLIREIERSRDNGP